MYKKYISEVKLNSYITLNILNNIQKNYINLKIEFIIKSKVYIRKIIRSFT